MKKKPLYTYINNFRYVNSYVKEPRELSLVAEYGQYKIYHSGHNQLIYVFINPDDGKYYAYESNGKSKNPIKDFERVIDFFSQKISE